MASLYGCLFSVSFGTLLMLLIMRTNLSINLACGIALVVFTVNEILLRYAYVRHSLRLYEIFFFVILICVAVGYTVWNMECMITRRKDFYRPNYVINGFFDMHTDLFFVFWKNKLSYRPKKNVIFWFCIGFDQEMREGDK